MRRLRDLGTAAALVVGLATLWFVCFQGRIYGNDGAMLADWAAGTQPASPHYHNPLFVRTEAFLRGLWPEGGNVWDPLRAMSAFTMAFGVGCAFLICRRLGANYRRALLGALFLAGTPTVTFFATCFEVHGLHFAIAAFAGLVTVLVPWHKTWLAAVLAALALGCTYLSHHAAPALGPGFVVLATWRRAQLARADPQLQPFGVLQFVGVGAVMLAGLFLGHATNGALRGEGFGIDLSFVEDKVSFWRRPFGFWMVWQGVLQPMALALPLGLLASWQSLRAGGAVRGLGATFLAFFVPLIAFVLWWGIPERGGYLLGPAFLLAVVLAKLRLRMPLLVLLVTAQAAFGIEEAWRFGSEGYQLDERARLIAEHIDGGQFVVSFNDQAPNVKAQIPELTELQLIYSDPSTMVDPDAWAKATANLFQIGTAVGPVLFDRSYTARIHDGRGPFNEQIDALEAELRKTYEVEVLDDESWPMWRLR